MTAFKTTKSVCVPRKSKDILRALLDPSQPDMVPWSSSELKAILEHQLNSSLLSELELFAEITQYSTEKLSLLLNNSTCHTFKQLLQNESPSIEILRLVKDFAKASLTNEGNLPKEVARVLYILTILRGRLSGLEDLTSLDETSIECEARRCLTYGWLPDNICQMIRNGIQRN